MGMMLPKGLVVAAVVVSAIGAACSADAASAVQKECSAKYKAAKSGGTLNGMTYNQFRKQCSAEVKTEKAGPTPSAAPTPPVASKSTTAAAPVAAGSTVFPRAVSSEFSKESPGKARMHTCLAQYNANKANGGNGALKWIMKGGGYYSECNKRLKS